METIKIENAGKCFKGKWVLRNVSMDFEAGRIYGLIGRNGAGKTMLLKMICGLAALSEGSITVEGKRIGIDTDIPESVGAVIEVPGFLPDRSGFENLKYLAGLRKRIGDTEIRDSIIKVGLDPSERKHVGKYSLGMRQRLGIAQAIMEDPDILLLDEPMNGLDTSGVADVKELLKKLKQSGKTIILASHYMEDVAELCDIVCRMEGGTLIRETIIADCPG